MKRRVTIHMDGDLYKRVRHRLIDQDMTLSGLVSRYLTRYLGSDAKVAESENTLVQQGELAHVASEAEDEFWDREAKGFDNAMPRFGRPRKGPIVPPVETRIRT